MRIPFLGKKKAAVVLETGVHGQLRDAATKMFGEDCDAAATAICPRMAQLVGYLDDHQPKRHEDQQGAAIKSSPQLGN